MSAVANRATGTDHAWAGDEMRNLRTPLAPTRVMGRMSVGALRVAFRTIVTDDALSGL